MTSPESPRVFRLLLGARDLEAARAFYEALLGTQGRKVADGRYYFDCGSVILGVLDYSGPRESEISVPTEAVYFSSNELEAVHSRARTLGCLSTGDLHGDAEQPLGEIRVRPWGESSFYAADPTGNALCFVDASTMFTGTPEQIDELRKALGVRAPKGPPSPRHARS